jgi:hypothetical protein
MESGCEMRLLKHLELVSQFLAIAGKVDRTKCRQYMLTEFEYYVIYRETEHAIEVVAVGHGKQRPGCWKKRLRGS